MAQANILQDVSDRVESAVKTFEKDWKQFQKRAEKRRKELERNAERRVKRIQKQLERSPVVKRAQSLRSDATKAAQEGVDALLATLRIASQSEVQRLERKVGQLNRKLRDLEKGGARAPRQTRAA